MKSSDFQENKGGHDWTPIDRARNKQFRFCFKDLVLNWRGVKVGRRFTPAILAGRIFDDRGNRMSPTHSNKLGVRYRYYVSHAILQKRKAEAGSIARVPAPEIEKLVVDGVRKHRASIGEAEHPTAIDDRDLIERYVDSVIVKPQALEVRMVLTNEASAQTEEPGINDPAAHQPGRSRSRSHGRVQASRP